MLTILLQNAVLCLNCEALRPRQDAEGHYIALCPACGSESAWLLSRWLGLIVGDRQEVEEEERDDPAQFEEPQRTICRA